MSTTVTEGAGSVTVPHHAQGARLARHRLTDALTRAVPPERLADATAVAAELIGNAVCHAAPLPGGVIRVSWLLLPGSAVEIRVYDGGSTVKPEVRDADPESIHGRGLTIVEALASRWGYENDELGQCVWAELR